VPRWPENEKGARLCPAPMRLCLAASRPAFERRLRLVVVSRSTVGSACGRCASMGLSRVFSVLTSLVFDRFALPVVTYLGNAWAPPRSRAGRGLNTSAVAAGPMGRCSTTYEARTHQFCNQIEQPPSAYCYCTLQYAHRK